MRWRIRTSKGGVLILAVLLITAYLLVVSKSKKIVLISGHKFEMELADNEKKRQSGLAGRDRLCDDCAMFFLFSQAGQYSFWMKGMKFPLDIIWVSESNKVIHIEKNVSQKLEGVLNPSVMANKVVEINAKLSDKYGFKIGDDVIVK